MCSSEDSQQQNRSLSGRVKLKYRVCVRGVKGKFDPVQQSDS